MTVHTSAKPNACVLLFSAVALLTGTMSLAHAGDTDSSANFNPYVPDFTDPQAKLEETAKPSFTLELVKDAASYEPLLKTSQTQVHMGFWSGAGNHGSLARVLDSINFGSTPCSGSSPNCAVWDEGATTSEQYPAYVTMLLEHWYDRGNATPSSPTVTIYGKSYPNTNPLDFSTADLIWGQYSQRYADMAVAFFNATGNPVMVWCFVQGASPTRVFYTYEYPELQKLEAAGVVKVHCALTPDADWTNRNDWSDGTGSAGCPAPN
ncbi:MAG: hypothetical protein JOY66_09820 [Acetobacteraceae bacterium]|nr:hypothetical protein [Acetobacteraceae bacterium]